MGVIFMRACATGRGMAMAKMGGIGRRAFFRALLRSVRLFVSLPRLEV